MKHSRLLVCLVLMLFTTTAWQNDLFAQKQANGEISGVIKELTTKESLPYATVTIKGTITGVVTDLDGNFRLPNLEAGNYNRSGLPMWDMSLRKWQLNWLQGRKRR